MVENNASLFNLRYKSDYDWGKLDAMAYWQNTYHKMNSGEDKLPINLRIPVTMPDMPMETRGIDTGYSLKTDIPFAETNILRLGNEFHRFSLDDWWPPVSGSTTMSPDTFMNINDGRRDRYAFFAEWESRWNKNMTTIIGVRNEQVRMDAGDVQGYNTSVTYKRDADAFNAQDHARNDSNWDLTALARFELTPTGTYEVGYARKTRSPTVSYTHLTLPTKRIV